MSVPVLLVMPDAVPIADARGEEMSVVFRAHYARLVRTLAVVCGDAEQAADAVQEAFVRAFARWRTLRDYEDPVGWVRHVALNLLRDDHRRTARKRRALLRLASRERATAPPPSEPDGLGALLAVLPRQQRVAVALHHVDGLSVAEVAVAMGVAEGTVKSHLHDARRALRTRLGGGDD